jgi:hypothetical protein
MNKHLILAVCVILSLIIAIFAAHAHDPEHHELSKWYQDLKQPDNPTTSCCGEADAYFADSFEQEKGQYVAIVTDERDDGPLKRPHIDVGTRVLVPNTKIKWDEGNPTGHGILFMTRAPHFYVYCYVPPGGV